MNEEVQSQQNSPSVPDTRCLLSLIKSMLAATWLCEATLHALSHKYVSVSMTAQANNRRTSWLVAALVPCLLLLSLTSIRHVTAAAAVAAVAPSKATASTVDQATVDEMVDEYMDDEDEFEESLAGDGKAADGAPKKKSTSKRKKKATLKNQVVEFAPAAIVVFGDDIDDEGRVQSDFASRDVELLADSAGSQTWSLSFDCYHCYIKCAS